jgi:MGT family glycosyltransferase
VKRFLFVVPPLAGHVNPTVSVARDLAARGHRVAWVGHPRRVRPLLPEGAELIALDDGVSDDVWRPVLDRARAVRGVESLQFLWEDVLVPLARGMLPGVTRAIQDFEPDVVAVDHQAIGGALAARRLGARWATLCTTSASVVDPLADLPVVRDWVHAQVADLQTQAGMPVVRDADLSPARVIVFSTEALVGAPEPFPAHYRFVGPSISDRPDATPFPWESLAPVPRVFVSLGTVSAEIGTAFYATVVEALRDLPVQVIVAAPPEQIPSPPASFIVRARVPQLALLPHVQAVVCHAGHNTVCESLASGVPLVVAPIRDDQPVIAGQVVRAGAGVRVKFGRLSAASLRAAVERALNDPELRAGAARLRTSFEEAGGARAAAQALEEMS